MNYTIHTVTSCLMPIGNAEGKHIVTIEGINYKEGLNPVQQAMADAGATQCGFCTPGFVMSLAGFCLSDKPATKENAIAAIDGNICRCTGYKSIEKAAVHIAEKLKDKKEAIPFVTVQKILPEYFITIKNKLQALSFRFLNKKGNELTKTSDELTELDTINLTNVDKRIMDCEFVVLCDVENVLLGKEGAAAVFGPQKGASPDDIKKLEASLLKLKDVILHQTGKDISLIKHGGAAVGVAAGLSGLLNAQLVNGIDYFLSITAFDNELRKADLVITGEGSIDIQTLQGKGPFGVAKRAKKKEVPVIGLAGKIPLEISPDLQKYFDILLSINHEAMELSEALLLTRPNLIKTANLIGDLMALPK